MGIKKKKQVKKNVGGRPKKDPSQVKKTRNVRVSDADHEIILEHGFTIQSLLDQAIGSLKPVDPEEMKMKLSTLKSAFQKDGL